MAGPKSTIYNVDVSDLIADADIGAMIVNNGLQIYGLTKSNTSVASAVTGEQGKSTTVIPDAFKIALQIFGYSAWMDYIIGSQAATGNFFVDGSFRLSYDQSANGPNPNAEAVTTGNFEFLNNFMYAHFGDRLETSSSTSWSVHPQKFIASKWFEKPYTIAGSDIFAALNVDENDGGFLYTYHARVYARPIEVSQDVYNKLLAQASGEAVLSQPIVF